MILEWAAAGLALVGVGVLALRLHPGRGGEAPKPRPATGSEASLAVGDVLLWGDDELWLAGALQLSEGGPVLTLFRTPGARSEWLAVLDLRGEELATLSASEHIQPGAVPSELRVDGHLLRLVRRGTAGITPVGEDLPAMRGPVTYTVLASAGGRTAVVLEASRGARLALLGRRVEACHLERLRGPSTA